MRLAVRTRLFRPSLPNLRRHSHRFSTSATSSQSSLFAGIAAGVAAGAGGVYIYLNHIQPKPEPAEDSKGNIVTQQTEIQAKAAIQKLPPQQVAEFAEVPLFKEEVVVDPAEEEEIQKERVRRTYLYTLGGLVLTAAGAFVSYSSGFAAYLMTVNPWIVVGASLLTSIPLLIGTISVDYRRQSSLKHVLWSAFSLLEGAQLGVVGLFGSELIKQALVTTAGVVGSVSCVGAALPHGSTLWLKAPLTLALNVMLGCGLFALTGLPMSALFHNVYLYGGAALMSLNLLYETDRLFVAAKEDPVEKRGTFDPVNSSFAIYLSTLNIFLRILEILSESEEDRKKRTQRK